MLGACASWSLTLGSGVSEAQACPHQRPSHLFHCPALQLISLLLAGSGFFGGWVVPSRLLSSFYLFS